MAIITLNNNSLSSVTSLPAGVGGKVLQVVTGTLASETTTTSSSYIDTGLDVLITPTSSSSKIFVTSSISTFNGGSGVTMYWTLYKNSSNLSNASGFFSTYNAGGASGSSGALNFLDSPSTTSQIEYSVYMKVAGNTGYISIHNATSTITVMEIAG